MAYLKTVITYNVPAEAEVDKSYLEAHGIVVGLLNANTSRNELGAPFYIQLQVADEDYSRAVELLQEANPSRFGSAARVAELDRGIRQAVLRFCIGALPAGILAVWLTPAPEIIPNLPAYLHQPADARPVVGVIAAVLVGSLVALFGPKRSLTPADRP